MEKLGASQSRVTRHMAALKAKGITAKRKSGGRAYRTSRTFGPELISVIDSAVTLAETKISAMKDAA
jgi:hypothetical protein